MNWLIRRHSYGVALACAGLPVVWIVRDLSGVSSAGSTGPGGVGQVYSIIFMIISLALIVEPREILRSALELAMPLMSRYISRLIPLLYLIPCIIASMQGKFSVSIDTFYLLFTVSFLVAINSVPRERFQFLPEAFAVVGGIGSAILLAFTLGNGGIQEGKRLGAGSTASPNQVASMGGNAVIAGLFLLSSSITKMHDLFRIYLYAAILIGTSLIIFSTSRAIVISIFLCIILAIALRKTEKRPVGVERKKMHIIANTKLVTYNKISHKKIGRFLKFPEMELFLIAFVLLAIAYYADLFDPILKVVGGSYEYFARYLEGGFNSYYKNTGEEASASIRRGLIEYAMKHITDQGYGYKALWLDFPILQAFYDGGILGGITFLMISTVAPAIFVIRVIYYKTSNIAARYCAYIYMFLCPALIFHGQPYDFYIWMRLILVYSLMIDLDDRNFLSHRKDSSLILISDRP